jgi:phosphonate transport system ATP-binding protein
MSAVLQSAAAVAVLEVRDLRVSYASGKEVLKGVAFDVGPQEFVAIIGPSGAGKSTLIRCVNRLVEPSSGQVIFDGKDLLKLDEDAMRRQRRNIGMIFQEFNLIDRLSVIDNVLTGRLGYMGNLRSLFRAYSKNDIANAVRLLDRVGLIEHMDKRADALSGGQRQRVGIARALMQRPKLLLADEPTSSLDPKTSVEIMTLMRDLSGERAIPAIVNIHNVELARRFATRIVGLSGGAVIFDGAPDALSDAYLKQIYGGESWLDGDGG